MNKNLIEKKRRKKKGFTLVELIIVIAIIAILAAMAIPKFGAVRLDARISNDVAAAKNIQSAAAILVSNGTLKETDGVTVDKTTEKGKAIIQRIDGNTEPRAQSGGSATFNVTVKNGEVTVASSAASNINLAPADDSTEKYYKDALYPEDKTK